MAVNSEQKSGIVAEYQRSSSDTGSAEVQVALLSARINDLSSPDRLMIAGEASRINEHLIGVGGRHVPDATALLASST